jgi:cytochrome c biogenesis protein CcmG/thiol:disulfide interchange protein DsbE
MKRIITVSIPLILFLIMCVFLYRGLYSDPTERKSEVLTKTFPAFSLPDLDNESILYTNDIFDGKVTLINVWGVWCVTCAIELPYLTALSEQGLEIVGLYYDQDIDPDFGTKTLTRVRQEVKNTVSKYGDPYAYNIFDVYRNTALDLGVTGAPEHFLVDQNGVIRVHHLGDITPRVWRNKFAPVLQSLAPELEAKIENLNAAISAQQGGSGVDSE